MGTLADCRDRMAHKPGIRRRVLTTGVRQSGTYAGVATGSDADRSIVSSDLLSMSRSGTDSNVSDTMWASSWVYLPGLGQQQAKVSNKGYSPNVLASAVSDQAISQRVGLLLLDNYLDTVVPANRRAEIWKPLPVIADDGDDGVHDYLNAALRVMEWPKRISLSMADLVSQNRVPLGSDYPWFVNRGQLVGAWDGSGDWPVPLPGGAWLETDGDGRVVVLNQFPTSMETLLLDVRMPPSAWIKRGARGSVAVNGSGGITAITVTLGGGNYAGMDPDDLAVTISGSGSGATAEVGTIVGGNVATITVLTAGSGYAAATTTVTVEGAWGYSTSGLVYEEDECLADPDDVATVAAFLFYDDAANDDPDGERSSWAKLRERFMDRALPLLMYPEQAEAPVTPRTASPIGAGGGMYGRWPG